MSSDEEEEDTSVLSSASSISDCIEIKTMKEHIVTVLETKKDEEMGPGEGGGTALLNTFFPTLFPHFLCAVGGPIIEQATLDGEFISVLCRYLSLLLA